MKNLSKNQLNRDVVSQANKIDGIGGKKDISKNLTAEDIIYSIYPLLEEYFVGTVSCNDGVLIYTATYGQKFKITAMKQV